jgi:addiction module HigA family antidote
MSCFCATQLLRLQPIHNHAAPHQMPRRSILPKELRECASRPAELSRQIDVPVNHITGIIHGHQRGIATADTALRLGHWFGTTPQFWMNLQQLSTSCAASQKRDRCEDCGSATSSVRSPLANKMGKNRMSRRVKGQTEDTAIVRTRQYRGLRGRERPPAHRSVANRHCALFCGTT